MRPLFLSRPEGAGGSHDTNAVKIQTFVIARCAKRAVDAEAGHSFAIQLDCFVAAHLAMTGQILTAIGMIPLPKILPHMKKILALFFLSLASAVAQEQVLDFGARGKLTLFLLGDWKPLVINMAGQYEVTFTPRKESINASCSFKVSYPEVDRYDTKARLKLRVEADGAAFADQSVEGKAYGKEFAIGTGYGFYCNFTDAALRGNKSAPPGEFKVVSAGKIRLAPDILIEVFMGADSFKDEAYQQLLGAIEGLEFKPGRGR